MNHVKMLDKVIDLLKKARALVVAGWTQKVSARDSNGLQVTARNPTATCFCMIGALDASDRDNDEEGKIYSEAYTYLTFEVGKTGVKSIPAYNDAPGRKQEEVVERFDNAILAAEEDRKKHGGRE